MTDLLLQHTFHCLNLICRCRRTRKLNWITAATYLNLDLGTWTGRFSNSTSLSVTNSRLSLFIAVPGPLILKDAVTLCNSQTAAAECWTGAISYGDSDGCCWFRNYMYQKFGKKDHRPMQNEVSLDVYWICLGFSCTHSTALCHGTKAPKLMSYDVVGHTSTVPCTHSNYGTFSNPKNCRWPWTDWTF